MEPPADPPASTAPDAALAARLRAAVRARYDSVAADACGQFPYPVGRESLRRLGYDAAWVDALPAAVAARFVGVGNPFAVHRPVAGDRVLDLGCGVGADALIAARLVGTGGHVVGVDLAPAMLAVARAGAAAVGLANVTWHEGTVEALPGAPGSVDAALSNGVLNLIPDKDAAFRAVARALRPGGVLAAADLVVVDTIPREVLARKDAWSS